MSENQSDSRSGLPDDLRREEALLDLHLERLDEEHRAWIEAELQRDASLRAKSDRLGRILQPLDHWRVSSGAANLADKVLDHVERSAGGREVYPVSSGEAEPRRVWFPGISMREMIAAAACILLLLMVLVPGVSQMRERSRRALCASNLGSIFQGVQAYQASFAGSLPFAGNLAGSSWLPHEGDRNSYASNSRHLYLLVRYDFGPRPGDFICPSDRRATPMATEQLAGRDDFSVACNLSYASLNLGGSSPNLHPTKPIAYLSDANPLFVNARFNPSLDPDRANSPAHGGKGQTVLMLDGSSRWMTRPVYGPQKDNLWVIRNVRDYNGTEAPTDEDDVQLVPGYPVTDPLVRQVLRY